MTNKLVLILSGALLLVFFLSGLLDIIYELDILDNLVSQILLFGSFIIFIVYLIKLNRDKHKKNLSDKTGSSH